MKKKMNEITDQVSLSTLSELVVYLERQERWSVDDIRLQLILSDLVSYLRAALGGSGATSQELLGLQFRLQYLAGRDLRGFSKKELTK